VATDAWSKSSTKFIKDVETKFPNLPPVFREVPTLMRGVQQSVAALVEAKTRRDESGKAKVSEKAVQEAETSVFSSETELLTVVGRRKPKSRRITSN